MQRFRFQQFVLGSRFFAPLPKMTPVQMKLIGRRLESKGFRTAQGSDLKAARGGATLTVSPSGWCSSNKDLSDAIAPVMPDVLKCRPKSVPLSVLRRSYYTLDSGKDELLLRLSPRLETELRWDLLRASGWCALTPDEQAVYSSLVASSRCVTPLLTDFPVEGSVVRRIGRRQYYESRLSPSEAASTLRAMGSREERNSYLPRDSMLRVLPPLGRTLWPTVGFEAAGQWCFLAVDQSRQKL